MNTRELVEGAGCFAAALPKPPKVTGTEFEIVEACSPRKGFSLVVFNDKRPAPLELTIDRPMIPGDCEQYPFNEIKESRCPAAVACVGSLLPKGTRLVVVQIIA